MRRVRIDPRLFRGNRELLRALLPPKALAILNANDVMPTNADGVMGFRQSSDLFYLSGIDQEETILVLFPDAADPKHREMLFLRETSERLALWEGHKLSQKEGSGVSGIATVKWLTDFDALLHQLMAECGPVFLNLNEHARASSPVETRDARFVARMQRRYPLHDYRRLAPLLHALRVVKSEPEIALIQQAAALTRDGFLRVLNMVRPGVNEAEIEAELAHEFIRHRAGFAYPPIVASGVSACVLHYEQNDKPCRKGELILLDAGACCGHYNADMTRMIPVSGRFKPRQRKVYRAVLRVLRQTIEAMGPGKLPKDLRKECETFLEKELVDLGLLTTADIRKQDPESPAVRKFFMHGVAHSLGLDVHDVGDMTRPIEPGWVLTCEPAIYIAAEGLGIRLENDILITEDGRVDLMADIPVEPEEIESLMKR